MENIKTPKMGDVVCRYLSGPRPIRLRVTGILSIEECDFMVQEVMPPEKAAFQKDARTYPIRMRPQCQVARLEKLRTLEQWCFSPE